MTETHRKVGEKYRVRWGGHAILIADTSDLEHNDLEVKDDDHGHLVFWHCDNRKIFSTYSTGAADTTEITGDYDIVGKVIIENKEKESEEIKWVVGTLYEDRDENIYKLINNLKNEEYAPAGIKLIFLGISLNISGGVHIRCLDGKVCANKDEFRPRDIIKKHKVKMNWIHGDKYKDRNGNVYIYLINVNAAINSDFSHPLLFLKENGDVSRRQEDGLTGEYYSSSEDIVEHITTGDIK